MWTTEESEESSNWREFTNVVETLEEEAASGKLDKCILYFFTDNSTVESALYKGTSSSRKLLELVIRVRLLETKHSITLHVVHVSGKRMIAVGVDGISRGLLNEGVMAGEKMLSFIPLHLTATERSPTLLPWIQSWVSEEVHSLSPYDWFQRGHDIAGWSKEKGDLFERPIIKSGVYGWFPPPAAADAALEQLRIARIKRQDSTHIFACPRLMTPMWLRQLYKASDIVFTVPLGAPGWPNEMLEPLIIGISFPFIRYKPWQLRSTPKMYAVGRELQGVWKSENVDARPVLRKLWKLVGQLKTVPERLVPRLLFLGSESEVSHRNTRR